MGVPGGVERRMKRNITRCAVVAVAMLAALALLTVRKEADGNRPVHANASASLSPVRPSDASGLPHTFSQAYDYCYVDENGRPMIFHRRRLVFFFPESPPEVNDRTFIETNECQ